MSLYYIKIVRKDPRWPYLPHFAFKSTGLRPLKDPTLQWHNDVCLDGMSDGHWMRKLAFGEDELPTGIRRIRRLLKQTEFGNPGPSYLLIPIRWDGGCLAGTRGQRIRFMPLLNYHEGYVSQRNIAFAWISERPDMRATPHNPIFARIAPTSPQDTYRVRFTVPCYREFCDLEMDVLVQRPWDSLFDFPWYEPAYKADLHERNARHVAAVTVLYGHQVEAFAKSVRSRPMLTDLTVERAHPDDCVFRYPYTTRMVVSRRDQGSYDPDERWKEEVGFPFFFGFEYAGANSSPSCLAWKASLGGANASAI